MQVVGFHGTTREVADQILAGGGSFLPSDNAGDWLGRGIYFFQDAPFRAHRWAQKWSCRRGGEPAVLKAGIDLGRCLDLLDSPTFALLQTEFENRDFSHLPAQQPLSIHNGRGWLTTADIANFRDRALINHACETVIENGGSVDTVRGAFLWGEAVFAESFVFDRSHVQIAVRNPDVITDVSLWKIPP